MANKTIKINSKNIKDRLKDETLDLSFCDLKEVPVREIALVKKATHLDLSNNLLTALPRNFVTIKQIVKLDLSHNMITEIPENFGEMTQLKYLDLYDNQISRLPLSLGELRNLRWLDLKENPLTNAVATVAGPCSNMSECQACARNVVAYLSTVKLAIEEEKLRRLNAASANTNKLTVPKTEGKKKKKKKFAERESEKNINKNGVHSQQNWLTDEDNLSGDFNYGDGGKCDSKGSSLYRRLAKLLMCILIPICIYALILKTLPLYNTKWSDKFHDHVHVHVKTSLRIYQRYAINTLQRLYDAVAPWTEHAYKALNHLYNIYMKDSIDIAKNKLLNFWTS